MRGAMLLKDSSEEFEVKVFVHPDSLLCLLLFIIVLETLSLDSTLGSSWRTCMPMTLLSLLNHSRNVSGGSLLGKKQWRRKDQVNTGKTKMMICGTGPDPCRVQASFHQPSVALEWAAAASSATAASTGCTRNTVGSSVWQRTLISDVHGAR